MYIYKLRLVSYFAVFLQLGWQCNIKMERPIIENTDVLTFERLMQLKIGMIWT